MSRRWQVRSYSNPKDAIEASRYNRAVSNPVHRDNGVGHMAMMCIRAWKVAGGIDYSWTYSGNSRIDPPCNERVASRDIEAVRRWYAY